jgi:hypothetical protein
MGFAGYVTVCVQLYSVTCYCLTLHVSAYMAILKCVGYFYFIHLEESSSLVFRLFLHVVKLCTFPFVFFLFWFSSLKEKASRQTHMQETTKISEKTQQEKHKWKCAVCVNTCKKKMQKTCEADTFSHMK